MGDNSASHEKKDIDGDDRLAELCTIIKQNMPEEMGDEAWYLLIATILICSPHPERLADLYTHLTTSKSTAIAGDAAFESEEAKNHLSLRLRDVLLKLVPIIGAPQVLCALIPFAKIEGDPKSRAESSTLSEKWNSLDVSQIHARGTVAINDIYGPHLLPQIFSTFGSHTQDMQFMENFTVYGLYLSDFSVLNHLEVELVVLVSIICTGLKGPSLWHLRGMGRLLGARGREDGSGEEERAKLERIKDTLRAIKVCAIQVVEWCGEEMVKKTNLDQGWVNVGDVTRELVGWGDDPFEK